MYLISYNGCSSFHSGDLSPLPDLWSDVPFYFINFHFFIIFFFCVFNCCSRLIESLKFQLVWIVLVASVDKGKFLLAARSFKHGARTEYIISLDADDFSQGSNAYGKLWYDFWLLLIFPPFLFIFGSWCLLSAFVDYFLCPVSNSFTMFYISIFLITLLCSILVLSFVMVKKLPLWGFLLGPVCLH